MRKTKDVEIFGKKATLSERSAQDVLNLAEYAGGVDLSPSVSVYIAAVALRDSLKYSKKWYQNFTVKKLLKSLTQKELFDLMAMILVIEGVDKKKVAEAESGEVSQDA